MEATVQDDDLQDELIGSELPPRPRRRLLTPLPLALLGVLLTACGFIGGVLVEKGQGQPSTSGEPGGLAARAASLRSTRGARGGASARSGGATVGEVAYVDAHTLYVNELEGNTVEVTASAGTTVTRTVKASAKAIRPGETVVVTGSPDRDGVVRAQSIRASQAVGAGGGLAGALLGGGGVGGGSSAGGGRGGGEKAGGGLVLFGK